MISQLHTQYIPKRAPSILYYPKGTLLVLYYIDPKKKHYIQKRTHYYEELSYFS